MNRRGFLFGLGGFIAAPAIVRAANLMPVRAFLPETAVPIGEVEALYLGLNRNSIRDLLLPGLRNITGNYPDISRQWENVFGGSGRAAARRV